MFHPRDTEWLQNRHVSTYLAERVYCPPLLAYQEFLLFPVMLSQGPRVAFPVGIQSPC